ncbi:MAG: mechanosensitive ion channel [Nibricoccus sp.]
MQALTSFTSYLQRFHLGPATLLVAVAMIVYLLASRRRVRPRPRLMTPVRTRIAVGAVRWTIIGIAVAGVLFAMGIDLQGVWSLLGAVLSLVAIGFVAMWSILSHMLASLLIVVFRPFELDDQIEIVGDDPVLGKVVDLNLVYTTLRTADGGTLRIPNNLFFQKVLKRHAPIALASERPSLA